MTSASETRSARRSGRRRERSDEALELSAVGQQGRRYRRRPALIGLGLGLLATCAAGSAYLSQMSSDAVPVLAIANDVPRGQIIEDTDLATALTTPDPALKPVPASERSRIVGQRAAADLTPGTLLTSAAVTSGDLPAPGQTIVGIAVTEAQMPHERMIPGDNVRVFDTPNPGEKAPKDPPTSISATVVSVSAPTDSAQIIVDVVVDDDVAGPLAARVATGRIAIVLDSAGDAADAAAETGGGTA